jgi:hypothetical protein
MASIAIAAGISRDARKNLPIILFHFDFMVTFPKVFKTRFVRGIRGDSSRVVHPAGCCWTPQFSQLKIDPLTTTASCMHL